MSDFDPSTDLPFPCSIPVPPEECRAYMAYHDEAKTEFNDAEIMDIYAQADDLFESVADVEDKRRLLFELAHVGSPRALEILDRYASAPDEGLEYWAVLARDECRSFALQPKRPAVITEAGGTDGKLRYVAILSARDGEPFVGHQMADMENAVRETLEDLNVVLEGIDFVHNYSVLNVLVPLDIAVGDALDDVIEACEERLSGLLRRHYYVGTQLPSQSSIFAYLKIAGEESDG